MVRVVRMCQERREREGNEGGREGGREGNEGGRKGGGRELEGRMG